jgi:ATP-dependent Clp protease ATP-binding subunit ClpA
MTPPPNLQDLIDTVRQDASTDNPLDQLATAAAAVAELEDTSDALLGYFVDRCRREGRSWSEISAALGVTKQAVHKRFAASVSDRIIGSIPAGGATMERFTSRARIVVSSAVLAARDAGRSRAGAVHILLALFAEPEGIAGKALHAVGVTREAVLPAVQASLPADEPDSPEQDEAEAGAGSDAPRPARFTSDGRLVLRNALVVALELSHNYIGTEHLLLGLYRDQDSPAVPILLAAGASEDAVKAQVTELLHGYRPPKVS